MAASGFGAGLAQGLQYQQQRQDDLDRQAQEMALRNAMQRLNMEEFDYRKKRDTLGDIERGNERTQKKQADALKEAQDIINDMMGRGYEGLDIAPRVSYHFQAHGVEPPQGFMGSVVDLKKSPEFEEKQRQNTLTNQNRAADRQARINAITAKMNAAEKKLFVETVAKMDAAGRDFEEESLPAAYALVYGQRATQPAQSQEQPAALQMDMSPITANPLLQSLGIGTQTPAAPTDAPQGSLLPGGGILGVSPKAEADMRYKQAIADAARVNALTKEQRLKFEKEKHPLIKATMLLNMEAKNQQIQERQAKMNEFQNSEAYREKMRELNLSRAVSQEEIRRLTIDQKKSIAEWLKRTGVGSEAELRAKSAAQSRVASINTRQSVLMKEREGVNDMMSAANAVLAQPAPAQNDPDYIKLMERRDLSQRILQTAPARLHAINKMLNELATLRAMNNKTLNLGVKRTNATGKPVNNEQNFGSYYQTPEGRRELQQSREEQRKRGSRPPAVSAPPRQGAKGVMKVAPPPGAKKDYSRMSDAELKKALARKLTGG